MPCLFHPSGPDNSNYTWRRARSSSFCSSLHSPSLYPSSVQISSSAPSVFSRVPLNTWELPSISAPRSLSIQMPNSRNPGPAGSSYGVTATHTIASQRQQPAIEVHISGSEVPRSSTRSTTWAVCPVLSQHHAPAPLEQTANPSFSAVHLELLLTRSFSK
jgi:hypothetical protein